MVGVVGVVGAGGSDGVGNGDLVFLTSMLVVVVEVGIDRVDMQYPLASM